MNNLEIKKQIDTNYNLIEQNYKPDCFVLNTKVAKLMEEINVLQNLCDNKKFS